MCNFSLTHTPRATLSQSLFWKFAVDPAESHLFYQSPDGQLVCLALESGAVQWQSEETALPLRVTDNVLWAIQSEWVQASTGSLSAVRGTKDELQGESELRGGAVRYDTPAADSEVLHYRVAAFSTETGHLLSTSAWLPTADAGAEIEHIQSHGNLSEQTLELCLSTRPPRQGIARPQAIEFLATCCQLNLITGAVCEPSEQSDQAWQRLLALADQNYTPVSFAPTRQRGLVKLADQNYTSVPLAPTPQHGLEGRVAAAAQLQHYWLLLQEVQANSAGSGVVKLVVLTGEPPHELKWERVVAPFSTERCPK